ncbi:MAG TPA: DUF6573 family protein [bacterium]|nr:DUF6573 family protein [bacterium]
MENLEIISAYTRAQAISDGVLIDISEHTKRMFNVPVAITKTAFFKVGGAVGMAEGEEKAIKILILMMLFYFIRNRGQTGDLVNFEVRHIKLKALSHPGDNGEHVITIMFPEED